MADTLDSKSSIRKGVRVQVPPPLPREHHQRPGSFHNSPAVGGLKKINFGSVPE